MSGVHLRAAYVQERLVFFQHGQNLREAFNKLDFDRDGYIALNELHRSLALVDIHNELTNKEQKRLCRVYYQLDENLDGRLDYNEFVRAVTKPDYRATFWQRILYRTADVVVPENTKAKIYSTLNERWFKPPPIFILSMCLLQVACYIWFLLHEQQSDWLDGCQGCFRFPSGHLTWMTYANFMRQEIWRYFAYTAIHAGFVHIAGNVIVQILIGVPLELVYKIWTVGPLYICGVLLGPLLQAVLDPQTIVIGASGGCYALLCVHALNLTINWRHMKMLWLHVVLMCIFFGVDLCLTMSRRLSPAVCPPSDVFVSWTPHLGGVLSGLAFAGYFLGRNSDNEMEKCCCWWMRIFGFIFLSCFTAALICLNFILPVESDEFKNVTCNFTIMMM